jgi:hypothetical protein
MEGSVHTSTQVDPIKVREQYEQRIKEIGAVMIYNCDPSTARGQAYGGKDVKIPPMEYRLLTREVANHIMEHDGNNMEGDSGWLTTDAAQWERSMRQLRAEGRVTNPAKGMRHVTAYADRIEIQGPKDDRRFDYRLWKNGEPIRDKYMSAAEDPKNKQVTLTLQRPEMGKLNQAARTTVTEAAPVEAAAESTPLALPVTQPEATDTCSLKDCGNKPHNSSVLGLCQKHYAISRGKKR